MRDQNMIALGYSIHDVLDAIKTITDKQSRVLETPSATEPVGCMDLVHLREAGKHLARIMCELTTPR